MDRVVWCMARNHIASGDFVTTKAVPANGEVWLRQGEHRNLSRVVTWLCRWLPKCGQIDGIGPTPGDTCFLAPVFLSVEGIKPSDFG